MRMLIQKAELLKLAGSGSSLARQLGVSRQAISQMLDSGMIPAERVLPICRALDNQVTPYELRPDIYPDPHWRPPTDGHSVQ